MMDWFYVAAAAVVVLQLLIGCFTFYCSILLMSFLAFIRYIYIPADCDFLLWFIERFGHPIECLKGRVVWITGASSGIGRALAIRLAQAGVRIALSARSVEALNQVKQICIETGGLEERDILVLPLDMIQYDQHQAAFDTVMTHFGKLDILVSNAGRSQRAQWEMIEADVDRELFELNVFSLISLARIVSKYFLEKGRGHLVVTSSVCGKFGAPMSASYIGSKYALQGYFECLQVEKARLGLDVTVVYPGPVESNLLKVSFTENKGEQFGQERIGKRMSAERCAHLYAVAIANRLTEAWMTGQPILTIMHLNHYLPFLLKMAMKRIPLKFIMKLRDGQDTSVAVTGVDKKHL
ncbi:dehydrogenase/reductase SDR family member 7-like [Homarus americanus]|uniref:dehydrogenase/reductase SDR family member 7-like n=1 Tax=Homarus americanus TaxID=6706 RepID=UPI001C4935BE|nr:dehydrogenase/reductase SDR family member 7-like [Homarus americanus]